MGAGDHGVQQHEVHRLFRVSDGGDGGPHQGHAREHGDEEQLGGDDRVVVGPDEIAHLGEEAARGRPGDRGKQQQRQRDGEARVGKGVRQANRPDTEPYPQQAERFAERPAAVGQL